MTTNSDPNNIAGILAGMARELRCSICQKTFQDAVYTPCSHTYCRKCIEKVAEENQGCILCKTTFTKRQLITASNVQAIADEFSLMRSEYEQEHSVDISQVPIMNLSGKYIFEAPGPRPSSIPDPEELPISDARKTELPRVLKVYTESEVPQIEISNLIFVDKINEETTHVLLKSDENKLVEKSHHYLLGILYGCYIVDVKWLKVAQEMNKITTEDRFEIEGEKFYGRTGAPKKSRLNRNEGKHQKLFKSLTARFISDDKYTKRYEKYVRLGGGRITDSGKIIVCNEDMDLVDVDEIKEQFPEQALYSKDWLEECILKYEIVENKCHVLQ